MAQRYNGSSLYKTQADYKLLLGPRENGKSYWWKHKLIEDCFKNKTFFCYLRRTPEECSKLAIESYFDDVKVEKITKKKFDKIEVFRKEIFLVNSVTGGRQKIGRAVILIHSVKIKSQAFANFLCVLYEEFCTDGLYAENEFRLFQNVVSTVLRGRENAYVICIGNTITRLCPYYREFGITNVLNQEDGTIEIYEYKGDNTDVTIAVEKSLPYDKVNKLLVGKATKLVQGGWDEKVDALRLPYDFREFEKCCTVLLEHELMTYMICLLSHKKIDGTIVYVYPTDKHKHLRDNYYNFSISNKFSFDINHATRMSQFKYKVFKVITENIMRKRIAFSDNLTATEFFDIINMYI